MSEKLSNRISARGVTKRLWEIDDIVEKLVAWEGSNAKKIMS